MTPLSPWWMWFGLLAVAIPIVLHFFYRARYRPVPWAAMKYLRLSIEQTSRRLRFQELILLLLRILVCLLLALALLRFTSCDAKEARERGKTVDAILIFDTSFSMAATEPDEQGKPTSRFEIAKKKALQIIDELPSNTSIRILTCSYRVPKPAGTSGTNANRTDALEVSSTNPDQAKWIIQNLELTHERTDFLPALQGALDLLKQCQSETKEVYLFSDMQRSGWDRQSAGIRDKANEIRSQAALYLVRCGEQKVRNVSITGIIPASEVLITNSRIPLTVMIHNSGNEEVTQLQLLTQVDGEDLERDAITIDRIPAGQTRPFTITTKIDNPGWHLVTAKVTSDDIEVDNQFDTFLYVRDKIRVLIVDGAPTDSSEAARAGSYFIAKAVTPVAADQLETYFVQRRVIRSIDAIPESLKDQDLCILVDVPMAGPSAPGSEFITALKTFTRKGGVVLITSGENVSLSRNEYNEQLGDLLPCELALKDAFVAPLDKPLSPDLQSIDELSFLAPFKQPGNQLGDLFSKADCYRVLPVVEGKSGRVLVRYDDGQPMVLARAYEQGTVYLLTTSVFRAINPNEAWSYLAINPSFPTFVERWIVQSAQRQGSSANFVAGTPFRWQPPNPDAVYYLLRPERRPEQPLGERFITLGRPIFSVEKGSPLLTVDETTIRGVYRIGTEEYRNRLLERERTGAPINEGTGALETFSVIPDLQETESLESMADEQVQELLGVAPVRKLSPPEWTIWFLLALVLFLFLETGWAWYCGRAW